jgi:hypothetical protein
MLTEKQPQWHRRTGLLLFLLVLATVGTGVADNFTLTGAGGPTGNNLGGVYVAPYSGTLTPGTSSALGTGPLALICDDFYDDVSIGQSWNVQVIPFSSGDLTQTHFFTTPADTTRLYEEVFYLIDQMNFSSTDPSLLLQNAELNWAIWSLTSGNPNLSNGLPDESAIQADITLAQENYASGTNYDSFYILAADPTGSGQEYITQTPEPACVVLFAAGLLGLFWRRKLF